MRNDATQPQQTTDDRRCTANFPGSWVLNLRERPVLARRLGKGEKALRGAWTELGGGS